MHKIFVSGLINIETTLKIDDFPVYYSPVNYPFFGINSSVSGVGLNVSKALTNLGNKVNFFSIVGKDYNSYLIEEELKNNKIDTSCVKKLIDKTPQSIILYTKDGKREIFVDLKDIQEQTYTDVECEEYIKNSDLIVSCNINFSRSFIDKAKKYNKLIATDIHTVSNPQDNYNKYFMEASDILFMSDENISESMESFVKEIYSIYKNKIIVIGMGKKGALLFVEKDDFIGMFPAVKTRKVVNTVGAGDALFSSFLHFYLQTQDPYISIKKAITFASYKIGEDGAANGFLTEKELNDLFTKIYSRKLPF